MENLLEQDVLLELLKNKDNRAYRHLYQCYYTALRELANLYVKDLHVAEDLVQDVFMSMLESNYNFRTENDIKYFLYTSLKNRCISHFRKQKVRDKNVEKISQVYYEEEHFWKKALTEDVYARLMNAIETLSPRCKIVMKLVMNGLTSAEIAQKLNISLDTVKEHKAKGKKKLAAQLKDCGYVLLINILCL